MIYDKFLRVPKASFKYRDNLEPLKQSMRLAVKNFLIERVSAGIDNYKTTFKGIYCR